MQEDQKGCKKNNNVRAEEQQITAARAKQHGRRGRRYRQKAEKDEKNK